MKKNRKVALDTETTGLSIDDGHKIIEIACIELIDDCETGNIFHYYINPERKVPAQSFRIHGISDEMLCDKPLFSAIAKDLRDFLGDAELIIHNAPFDLKFMNHEFSFVNMSAITNDVVDTLLVARRKFPGASVSLDSLCKRVGISLDERQVHSAFIDTKLLIKVYLKLFGSTQTNIDFSAKMSSQKKKEIVQSRQYQISDDEIDNHKKMLSKINNALWNNYT